MHATEWSCFVCNGFCQRRLYAVPWMLIRQSVIPLLEATAPPYFCSEHCQIRSRNDNGMNDAFHNEVICEPNCRNLFKQNFWNSRLVNGFFDVNLVWQSFKSKTEMNPLRSILFDYYLSDVLSGKGRALHVFNRRSNFVSLLMEQLNTVLCCQFPFIKSRCLYGYLFHRNEQWCVGKIKLCCSKAWVRYQVV